MSMSRNRFRKMEPVRIPISGGDWVEVRDRLNNGEEKRLEAAGMKDPIRLADGSLITPIDWELYEIERAMIFLLDWSLRDENDKPVKLTRDALRAIDSASFEEINQAIYQHVGAIAAAKAAEKNALRAIQSDLTPPEPSDEPTSIS